MKDLNDLSFMTLNIYHTQSCTDADGTKQTTKLMVSKISSADSNIVRWSDCQVDDENTDKLKDLDAFRDKMNNIIKSSHKSNCD